MHTALGRPVVPELRGRADKQSDWGNTACEPGAEHTQPEENARRLLPIHWPICALVCENSIGRGDIAPRQVPHLGLGPLIRRPSGVDGDVIGDARFCECFGQRFWAKDSLCLNGLETVQELLGRVGRIGESRNKLCSEAGKEEDKKDGAGWMREQPG